MKRLPSSVALLAAAALAGCGGSAGISSLPNVATVSPSSASNVQGGSTGRSVKDLAGGVLGIDFSLFDAPLPRNAQVDVALLGVDLVSASGEAYPLEAYQVERVVNLLTLRKHPLALSGGVPAGSYAKVRLLVDPANSALRVGKTTTPLVWPADATTTSGVVAVDVPLNVSGGPGQKVRVTADFNVLESLQFNGQTAKMKPHVVAATSAGAIAGKLVNASRQPVTKAVVEAIGADGTVANSTITGPGGSFALHALSAGTYTVRVQNAYTSAAGTAVEAANADAGAAPSATAVVSPNATADLGTIED